MSLARECRFSQVYLFLADSADNADLCCARPEVCLFKICEIREICERYKNHKLLREISLFGRPERSYHPKVRHFAVVDAILYPPKVSSERVVDDVGTPQRWVESAVPLAHLP